MIGAVEFLKLPGSISSVEYPLLTSASMDLTSVTVKRFANVKFTEDLVQDIRVPYFADYSKCSMVRMNSELYWIVGYSQDTLTQSSITFRLNYNGPSSRYHKGDTMYGIWERTGNERKCDWLQYTPFSGEESVYSSTTLPVIRDSGSLKRYYVQVTTKARFKKLTYADAQSAMNDTEQDRMTIYAFFADANALTGADAGAIYPNANDTAHVYPQISMVIDDIENLGISASNVVDISISERSPFPVGTNTASTCNISGVDLSTNLVKVGLYAFYRLDPSLSGIDFINSTTISLPGSGAIAMISRLDVVDESGSSVGSLPYSARSASTLKVTTFADFTGIYTRIDATNGSNGRVATVCKPEGKLPWVGSTWEEYRAYAMAYDRQSVANANTLTTVKGITGMTSGIVGSAVGGAMVGGVLGAGIGILGGMTTAISSTANIAAETSYARNEQKNLEKRTQAQPGTAYAPQYGRNYIIQTCISPTKIQCMVPLGALRNTAWITQYTQYYGYPDDGVWRGLTAAKGYFKGTLVTGSDGRTGPKFDRCNDIFQNGFRFIEV